MRYAKVCAVILKERDAQRRPTERTEMEFGRPGAEVQWNVIMAVFNKCE